MLGLRGEGQKGKGNWAGVNGSAYEQHTRQSTSNSVVCAVKVETAITIAPLFVCFLFTTSKQTLQRRGPSIITTGLLLVLHNTQKKGQSSLQQQHRRFPSNPVLLEVWQACIKVTLGFWIAHTAFRSLLGAHRL